MRPQKPRHGGWLRGINRSFRGFRSAERGTTAIEFGIIALPFAMFIYLVLDTALLFWASQLMENGVANSGRLIRTGQVRSTDVSKSDFTNMVCAEISALFTNCAGKLKLDVDVYNDFSAIDPNPPVDPDLNFDEGQMNYNTGGPEQIVMIRAFYEWDTLMSWTSLGQSWKPGVHLMTATTAFRNEPFPD